MFEPLARPILRCLTDEDAKDQILPGPIFGRAIWRGLIPSGTREIWISPTNQEGRFAFRIASLQRLSLFDLITRAQRPTHVLEALLQSAIGGASRAERPFRRALMSTPLDRYGQWRAARRRPIERSGLDALPPSGGARGPHIRIIAPNADEAAIAHWLSILRAQPWPNWSLAAPIGDRADGDVKRLAPRAKLNDALLDLLPDDLVAIAEPNEDWAPEALAMVGSAARRETSDIFYGDEELTGPHVRPLFKPDWGPIAGRSFDLIGRAWFARVDWAQSSLGEKPLTEISRLTLQPKPGARVKHIARVMLSRPGSSRSPSKVVRPPRLIASPSATIVIPTRDRVDLLQQCVAGLIGTRSDFEAIIVDNGSVEPQTRRFLTELAEDARFRVLARPGPFNFSALCNDAAREARAATLVFLNNDTEARSPDWLEKLISWTPLPTIGAVGAKLIFPDGRLQHAGVVVGIDGHANHYELPAGQDGAGYFERLQVPHELSAVTGACLAVEKAKFDAVGGFDADNLPVEFNDIDLCLRLAERGWLSLLEPHALLVHHQAATRKVSRDQERRYAAQVAYFKNRWRSRLRADPFFHPALSLDWHSPALG
ncbi:MAG TPA: glycosyltransferase [Roseiarcus sp.]|nr:glycosyltransferase [Roseiarcus sp.]